MPGTVLQIAHGFPPASGSGSNRALAFARYLPAFGWRPVVLTPGTPWASNSDVQLLAQLPPGVTVVRTSSFERRPGVRPTSDDIAAPTRGASPGGRVLRGGLKSQVGHARRFPDAHRGWTIPAVAAGWRVVRDERVDLLYSTAGPFTCHVVALALHRLTGLPWVAELRDGWYRWNRAIFADYPRWRGWLEEPLERAVVRGAARVVLVTDLMAEAFRRQYPGLPAGHFQVVSNGFDPQQLRGAGPPPSRSDRFQVLHAGALYHGRGIASFLEAAGRLAQEDADFACHFELRLVGSLDGEARSEVARQVDCYRLGDRVSYAGYLDHEQALAAMRAADLLLLVSNTTPGAEAAVPGKLFEYLAVRRPVLAVTPGGADAAAVVWRTRAGWVAPAHDPDAIREQLASAFAAHRRGDTPRPDDEEIARFDRRYLTRDLARVFDAVLAERGHAEPPRVRA